ncbi:O-antigen ligase-related protein [Candidatus Magnetomorum sp. HK-1]|nr:O-antigen ligase-related protein [Candidatus Magnetomorum sp. HK-1]
MSIICSKSKIAFWCGFIGITIYALSLSFPVKLIFSLVILCLSGIIVGLFNTDKQFSIYHPIVIFVLIFIFSLAISHIISADKTLSFHLSLIFFPALLIFFLIIELLNTDNIFWLYILFTIICFIISTYSIIIAISNLDANPAIWIKKMANPSILVPNDLIILTILLPFSFFYSMKSDNVIFKAISILTIFLSIITICVYQSRLGMLLIFINILLFCIIFYPRYLIIITFSMFLSFIFFDWLQNFSIISKCKTIGWLSRIPLWITAYAMFVDAPFLGQGPRTFGVQYFEYLDRINFPDWFIIDKRFTPWAHNIYLEVLAEQGLFGFTAFSFIIIYALYLAIKLIRSKQDGFFLLSFAPFTSFIIILIAGFFELSFIRHWFVIIFFMLLAIIHVLSFNNKIYKRRRL